MKTSEIKSSEAAETSSDDKTSFTVETLTFPPPKYVVTIVSPRVIHLESSDASLEEWKEFERQSNNDKATTLLNLHLLLVSLLNRLLRARLFPRRAVHSYIAPAAGMDDQEWQMREYWSRKFGWTRVCGTTRNVRLPILESNRWREEEDLLTVPLLYSTPLTTSSDKSRGSATKPPPALAATMPATAFGTSLPDSTVLVMAHHDKKTKETDPDLKTVVSETFEQSESELVDIEANAAETRPAAVQCSIGHSDVVQSAKENDTKSQTDKSCQGRAKPLHEIIPEAKTSSNTSKKEDKESGDGRNNGKSERPGALKSDLIQKVLGARKEWLATASRIRVEQVEDEITSAAAMTWDYLLFVVCAAEISAMGLATNSSATVLASMLVSPIMGPIFAVTFETMIRRPAMIQKALRNEAVSLLLCVLVGACGGIMVWWTRLYESSDWPAFEMTARGEPVGLAADVLIALPSGMATALSTLGKNSSGLVGVAISLSLLPPAVNAGLCWMLAWLENTRLLEREPDDDTNYWKVGTTSFGLTLINIVCIWLAGVFTFWLKEVAPVEQKNAFWSRDLKIARQKPKETGTGTIKDGLQAAMDLKKKYNIDLGEDNHSTRTLKQRHSRRLSAFPSSDWKDALLFDRNPVGSRLPRVPERNMQPASSECILKRTEALGGFESAKEILFNDSMFDNGDGMGTDETGKLGGSQR